MTKSLVTYILGAVSEVLADHQALSPTTCHGVDRDLSRLSSLAKTRGLPVFTLDLPALGKHFDKCLANGRYTKLDGPLTRTINAKTPIPRLFSGLVLAVFARDGVLRLDACVHAIATLRQLYGLAKKLEIACKESRTYESVRQFYRTEERLPPPSLEWGQLSLGTDKGRYDFKSYRPDLSFGLFHGLYNHDPLLRNHLEICQNTFDIISCTLGEFKPLEYKAKHGPGAVADGRVGEFLKYTFPTWSSRLERMFPIADYGYANYLDWAHAESVGRQPREVDVPSVLIAVPKSQKTPRLIAKEPTANQWCQQVLLDYFVSRIKKTFIGKSVHFDDQTYNQRLAQSASRTDSHWTVDLSAASDSVSCRFIERAFRSNPDLLEALNASRTHYLTQKIDRGCPLLIKLKKFSTMGSACTFPIESLVFYGLAISSLLISRGLRPTFRNIGSLSSEVLIFGDDMIVPKDSGLMLETLLSHFDFEVNTDKTFKHGKFRESCGVDAYDGVDVTPAYIKGVPNQRKPGSIASMVDTSNNFFTKGYWKTSAYLQQQIPLKNLLVVAVESGVFGLKSFVGSLVRTVRYDEDLQIDYTRCDVITSRCKRVKTEDSGQLLQYFTEAPPPETFVSWSSGYSGRPLLKVRSGRAYLRDLGRVFQAPGVKERMV